MGGRAMGRVTREGMQSEGLRRKNGRREGRGA